MSSIKNRINAFAALGNFLNQFNSTKIEKSTSVLFNDLFFDGFIHQIKLAEEQNSWFTKEAILFSIENWANALTHKNLTQWISNENIIEKPSKTVAIIMAGNIPLVGFHDFLSVLLCGHSVLVKQSSNDKHLIPYLSKYLEYVEQDFKEKISFTDKKIKDFDAVIATGSTNTTRYFEYYFKNKPNIIRRNRNSVAIITGEETKEDIENLSEDIFRYFGLGCRSVSKLFVPKNYDFNKFFEGMYTYRHIINNTKYANNYDYNKAVYLMSEFSILENGFLMIKEDTNFASPIATVFYEYYDNLTDLKLKILSGSENIQCVVANNFIENEVKFGQTQQPKLWDYADGVNTIEFLSKI
jgi:hypothetical protein